MKALIEGIQYLNLGSLLLASLPISSFITTNYDQILEKAFQGQNQTYSVLPYAPKTDASRWILKMHGCVTRPEDIVLTRQSYIRYSERNQALAGIVQAMLITKKMLFTGFSLTDENFLKIMDAVKYALNPGRKTPGTPEFGTALFLESASALEKHWDQDLKIVSMGKGNPDPARTLEIFLDYLAFRTAAYRHLLNPRYESLLTPEEILLKESVSPLVQYLSSFKETEAARLLKGVLKRLGYVEKE